MKYLLIFNEYLLKYRTYRLDRLRKLVSDDRILIINNVIFNTYEINVMISYIENGNKVDIKLIYSNDAIYADNDKISIETIMSYFFSDNNQHKSTRLIDYINKYRNDYHHRTIIGNGGAEMEINLIYQIYDRFVVNSHIFNFDGTKFQLNIYVDMSNRVGWTSSFSKEFSDEHQSYMSNILSPFFNMTPKE